MTRNTYFLFFVILMVMLNSIGHLAVDLYLPALPIISKTLGCKDHYSQLTLSFYFLGFAITPLLFGPYSDIVGRKKIILVGSGIAVGGSLICYAASNVFVLILGRMIQGVGLGAVTVAARSVVTDKFNSRELARFLSLLAIVMPAVLSIAPNIGSFILKYYSWRHIFLFMAICFFVVLVCIYFLFANTNSDVLAKKSLSKQCKLYITLLFNKKFILFNLYVVMTWMGLAAFITVSPFLLQNVMGLSPSEHGLSFFLGGGMVICGGMVNMRLLKYFSSMKILPASIVTVFLSGMMLLMAEYISTIQLYIFFAANMIFSFGIPFALSNSFAMALSLIPKRDHGVANAFMLSVQIFAAGISSFAFSFMPLGFLPFAFFLVFISMVYLVLILKANGKLQRLNLKL